MNDDTTMPDPMPAEPTPEVPAEGGADESMA